MSTLRVNNLADSNGTGSPTFINGISIPDNKTVDSDLITISGNCSANELVGNGEGLTNIPGVTNGKLIAFKFLF